MDKHELEMCFDSGYRAYANLKEAKKGCEERDVKKAITFLSDAVYYTGRGAVCGVEETAEKIRFKAMAAFEAIKKEDWEKAQDDIETAISYFYY